MNIPVEIQDYIIYLSGLDNAIKLNNKYVISKIISELKRNFENDSIEMYNEIFCSYSGQTIEFLYKNNYLDKNIIKKMNNTFIPSCTTEYLDSAVLNSDLKKLQTIDLLFPKSVIDYTCISKNTKNNILEWISKNRPCKFGHLLIKNRCLFYNIKPDEIRLLPQDVQNTYLNVKCNCKIHGNDVGYFG